MKKKFMLGMLVGCMAAGMLTGCGSKPAENNTNWNAAADEYRDNKETDNNTEASVDDSSVNKSNNSSSDSSESSVLSEIRKFMQTEDYQLADDGDKRDMLEEKIGDMQSDGKITDVYDYDTEANGVRFLIGPKGYIATLSGQVKSTDK